MRLESIKGICLGLCENCEYVRDNPTIDIEYCRKSNTLQKLTKIESILVNMLENSKTATQSNPEPKHYVNSSDDNQNPTTELENLSTEFQEAQAAAQEQISEE